MIHLKWRQLTGRYQYGNVCYAGKIKLGGVDYDSCRSHDDPKKYKPSCTLPQIVFNPTHYDTLEQAKTEVESAIQLWFKHIEENNQ